MVHLFGCIPGVQGVTKRCRPSWLTNSARVYEPKCGGGGVARSQPMSRAAYKHGGQINCGDLTPYLTYVCWCPLSIFLKVKVCLPLTSATFCSSCYCWKLFSKFLFSDFFVHLPMADCTIFQSSCCCLPLFGILSFWYRYCWPFCPSFWYFTGTTTVLYPSTTTADT